MEMFVSRDHYTLYRMRDADSHSNGLVLRIASLSLILCDWISADCNARIVDRIARL